MIIISDKHNCCGCGACEQVCSHLCITLKRDNEGFLYPQINQDKCTNCGLCEKTCPLTNPFSKRLPKASYYAYSSDEQIRAKGSSGGLFYAVAQQIIRDGGIVFGARFDEQMNVVHDCTDSLDGLTAFCGSKYVQSDIGNSYGRAKSFLDDGRTVLFSGTPCEIHGLTKFLKKEYPNLLTLDFVCHGVPSPTIWHSYLSYTAGKNGLDISQLNSINFRDKSSGWKAYSVTISDKNNRVVSTPFKKDSYMQSFLSNYNLRPSCYNCRFKDGANISDITLGDFWGVSHILPEADDDKGLSILLANTSKGDIIVSHLDSITIKPLDLQDCLHNNPSYSSCSPEPVDRNAFWDSYRQSDYSGALTFLKSIQPSTLSLIKYKIKCFFRSLTN